MGTASTMNALAEAMGLSLTGCAAIPAAYRERGQMAYRTGKRVVEMVHEDLRPSQILTREAMLNAVRVNAAIGGSTNAQPHLAAIAETAGVELSKEDWQVHGYDIPLLADVQPAGRFLSERFHRAGGVPGIMWELAEAGVLDTTCLTVTGQSMGQNLRDRKAKDREVIRPYAQPLMERAGFRVLTGNLFDFAIMKTCVISEDFRRRFLSDPGAENCFEGRAVVFNGSEDYHARINTPDLGVDESSILVIRGSGPLGWPGAAEVVNMQPPDRLIRAGITSLPTIGDGRQSGTADSPSIVHASPESAAGGGLAWLHSGDMIRIDLNAGRCDMLVPEAEIEERRQKGLPPVPPAQTPWQKIYRQEATQLSDGAVLRSAEGFHRVGRSLPRHNH